MLANFYNGYGVIVEKEDFDERFLNVLNNFANAKKGLKWIQNSKNPDESWLDFYNENIYGESCDGVVVKKVICYEAGEGFIFCGMVESMTSMHLDAGEITASHNSYGAFDFEIGGNYSQVKNAGSAPRLNEDPSSFNDFLKMLTEAKIAFSEPCWKTFGNLDY